MISLIFLANLNHFMKRFLMQIITKMLLLILKLVEEIYNYLVVPKNKHSEEVKLMEHFSGIPYY